MARLRFKPLVHNVSLKCVAFISVHKYKGIPCGGEGRNFHFAFELLTVLRTQPTTSKNGKDSTLRVDREQSLGRKEGLPTTHQETKYTRNEIRNISFLDVLSSADPPIPTNAAVMTKSISFTAR
jgi:hypothetical protein